MSDKALGALIIGVSILALGRGTRSGPVKTQSPGAGPVKGEITGGTNMNGGLPRGIRNNNPGNIEKGENWRGLASDQSGDPRFAVFSAPEWGIRAMAVILRNYRRLYGLNTIRGIISRWAPAHENDSENYANFVSRQSGYSPDEILDLSDQELARIIPDMNQMENGAQPYSSAVINAGIGRA